MALQSRMIIHTKSGRLPVENFDQADVMFRLRRKLKLSEDELKLMLATPVYDQLGNTVAWRWNDEAALANRSQIALETDELNKLKELTKSSALEWTFGDVDQWLGELREELGRAV